MLFFLVSGNLENCEKAHFSAGYVSPFLLATGDFWDFLAVK
jgi:hypothetical protein